MEELDIAAVTKRSIHGVFALVTRSFFIQLVTFVTVIILAGILDPSAFGVYAIVSSVIAFLQYFSDIGLAAALIQKKESISQEDLTTTFTIQLTLVTATSIIALFLANFVGRFYHLQANGILLFQALVISFFLSSLKTVPSVLLERNLHFEKLVIPQLIETLFYSCSLLFFAIKGFGITSFTYAVFLRGVTGVIAMYIVSPWMPRIGFSKKSAKHLLSFGIPFQANSLLALLKDDLLIAYIGKVLPLAQVGYIGFAQRWAFAPLRLIMDNVIRITFPSFSRLQHEKQALAKGIEKSIYALCLLIFPSLIGLVLLSPLFIHVVPKYIKWEPALVSLGFFALNAGLSSISTPLVNALNAIGKIKLTLYLMVFWTIITWVLTPLLIWSLGFNGVSIASAIIALSVVFVVWLTKRYVSFSTFRPIGVPLLAAIIMGIAVYCVRFLLASSWVSIILLIVTGIIVYFGVVFMLAKKELIADFILVKKQFAK